MGSYNTLNYTEQGGARRVVASGGSLDVESGGELDIESGGALKLAGTAITASAAEINGTCDGSSKRTVAGTTTAPGTPGATLDSVTGLTTITAKIVQILRSTAVVTGDAKVTVSGGTISVASGDATYTLTAGDIVEWIANGV